MTSLQSCYVIDTSALADLFIRRYPRKIFGTLWCDIDHLAADARLLTVQSVVDELKPGESRETNPITTVAHEARALHSWLVTTVSKVEDFGQQYKTDVETQGVKLATTHAGWSMRSEVADPYVIAAARLIGGSVVSSETGLRKVALSPNGFYPKSTNIPSICQIIGIPHLNLVDLFATEGWQY